MTKKLTFCSMLSLMGAACLMISNLFSANTIFLYLFSTLFCYIATAEYGYRYGILTAAAVTLLGFLTVGNKLGMAAYAMTAAYYPMIKHWIEHAITRKALRWGVKIAWFCLIAAAAYGILRQFLAKMLPLYLLFLGGVAVGILYDIALTMGIQFYGLKLRKNRH